MREQSIVRGQTGNIGFVFILDTSSTIGAGLTGVTSASSSLNISVRREKSSAVTTYSGANIGAISTLGTWANPGSGKINIKAVDATNMPGMLELHFEDTLHGASDTSRKLIGFISGVTNMAPTPFEVPLAAVDPQTGTNFGLSALPTANAGASGGLLISGSNTGTTTFGAFTVTGATTFTGAVTASNASNAVTGIDTVKIGGQTASATFPFNFDNLAVFDQTFIRRNTAQDGASTTITLDASASASNSFYVTCLIKIVSGTGGTGTGQQSICTAYVGSTKVATVSPAWVTPPDNTSVFEIYNLPLVNVKQFNGTQQTARDIGSSVLLSSGTGTGQVSLSSGLVSLAGTQTFNNTGTWTGSLTGSVGTVGGTTLANLDAAITTRMATYTQPTGFLAAAFPTTVASTTNITGGVITTVTNLTNAPTTGDFTGTMKTSLNAATPASVVGAVGSVAGNVGGNVTGSVGSIAPGGITTSSFTAGAIDAAAIATDAIGSAELAASAISEIQSGLSTLAAADIRTAVGLASANLDTQLAGISSGSTTVNVLPIAITSNTTFYATDYLPDMPKGTAPTVVWSVTDANENAVNLTGKVVRIATYDRTDTLIFKHSTNDVSPAISVGGTSHNTVTWNVSTTDTATVRDMNYMLWNITDNLVLAKGGFSVIDAVQS